MRTCRTWPATWATPAGSAAAAPAVDDKRFAGEAWSKDPRFDAVRKMYLAYAGFIEKAIDAAPVDEREKGQLRFAGRQFVDAMSPANFFVTNPEAIQLAMETGGASVNEGMKRFFEDFAKGRITTTDESVFEVGRNIAVTPGSVVFENDLIQLIQYTPTTEKVYERPFVVVPPCINKFYILDLQPENSFVAYAVGQGHTVFVVSWRNVKEDLGTKTWDDYLREGPMKAIDVALEITGADQANTLGFCVGGTIAGLGRGGDEDQRRREDLEHDAADLDARFLRHGRDRPSDRRGVGRRQRKRRSARAGCCRARSSASCSRRCAPTTSSGRTSSTATSKARGRPAFDLLYWNSDATNLPGPMFCWYVRQRYLQNDLRVPGKTIAVRRAGGPAATSISRRTSTPRARTTSCRGRAPTSRRAS